MSIKNIKIDKFLAFKNALEIEFCDGVNILIGGNGTGKTTILRNIYDLSHFKCFNNKIGIVDFETEEPVFEMKYNSPQEKSNFIFIPETNILPYSKGLIPLDEKYNLAFDEYLIDIVKNAQLPELKKMPEEQQKLLDILSEIIHGTVEYENDTFYIVKFSGERIEFKDEASGYTRLGLLWKLIRNGLFEPGTVLLWDEPENSLNPNVMSTLVDVLFELSRQGVQIIATTHDEIFAKYFDINKQEKNKLKYISLYKEDGILKYDTDERFDLLKPNNLLNESAEQYLREIEKGI